MTVRNREPIFNAQSFVKRYYPDIHWAYATSWVRVYLLLSIFFMYAIIAVAIFMTPWILSGALAIIHAEVPQVPSLTPFAAFCVLVIAIMFTALWHGLKPRRSS